MKSGFHASQLDRVVLALSVGAWGLALAGIVGLVPLAGRFTLGLYPFYALSVALGWILGNVYVWRGRRATQRDMRRRLLIIYLLGPPGLLFLLRSLAVERAQEMAPLAATWGFAVYLILFLVPVTLKPHS